MVAADLAVQRADQQPVEPQQADQDVPHRQLTVPAAWSPRARCRQRSRSAPSSWYDAPAAGGERADHQHAAGREDGEALPAQVAESALDTMADDGVARRPG